MALRASYALVAKALTEVKTREDDYQHVKSIVSRIKGISSSKLNQRDRKLLHHGPVSLEQSTVTSSPDPDFVEHPQRSSRLVDAINDWGGRRNRSNSVKSTASSQTGVSFRSVDSDVSVVSSAFPSALESALPPVPSQNSKHSNPSPRSVHAFIFTDVLLLAESFTSHDPSSENHWILLEDVGICRILAVNTHIPQRSGAPIDRALNPHSDLL